MNKKLFRTAMKNNHDTIISIAECLGKTRQTVSTKIKNGTFTSEEIAILKNRWNLTSIGVDNIFLGGEK